MQLRTELLAAQTELKRLTVELATERAISTRFMHDRDTAVAESARLSAALATEQAISARHLKAHDTLLLGARQHVQLSHYLGEYTSEFVDRKSATERAALRGGIYSVTQTIWNSGLGLSYEKTIVVIRAMMATHGFVFRNPGEGKTSWGPYTMMVKDVGVAEQLDRVVRTHRAEMGAVGWYLNELTAVMCRVVKYLEANP